MPDALENQPPTPAELQQQMEKMQTDLTEVTNRNRALQSKVDRLESQREKDKRLSQRDAEVERMIEDFGITDPEQQKQFRERQAKIYGTDMGDNVTNVRTNGAQPIDQHQLFQTQMQQWAASQGVTLDDPNLQAAMQKCLTGRYNEAQQQGILDMAMDMAVQAKQAAAAGGGGGGTPPADPPNNGGTPPIMRPGSPDSAPPVGVDEIEERLSKHYSTGLYNTSEALEDLSRLDQSDPQVRWLTNALQSKLR